MARLGIFRSLNGSMGGIVGLSGPVEDFIASCKSNCVSMPREDAGACKATCDASVVDKSQLDSCKATCDQQSTVGGCQSACEKFASTASQCGPQCGNYRQDSNEWLYCIQKCHGVPSSQAYDEAQKQICAKQGMTYSWIESKCVDTNAYKSCPTGTIYATYSDGSAKCIGINADPNKTVCPPGTTEKSVPSPDGKAPAGRACVSPVSPVKAKTPPVKVTPPSGYTPGGGGGGGGATLAGMSTGWLLIGIGALAVVGLVVYAKRKKQPMAARPNRRRRRR